MVRRFPVPSFEIYYFISHMKFVLNHNENFSMFRSILGTYGIDGSGSDFVLCSIGDVSTRILLVQIYLVILAGCFIASIVITCKEIYTAKELIHCSRTVYDQYWIIQYCQFGNTYQSYDMTQMIWRIGYDSYQNWRKNFEALKSPKIKTEI